MQLKFTHDIENNIFSTDITISGFGTEQLSEDDEKELLHDFPTKIAYRTLSFTKNVKVTNNVPIVTEDEVGTGVVAVTVPPISNKEILLDENFAATYKIDVNKVAQSAVDTSVLTTKELVAQAYCIVFDEVIRGAVESVLTGLRSKAPSFSGENYVDV